MSSYGSSLQEGLEALQCVQTKATKPPKGLSTSLIGAAEEARVV